MKLNVDNMHNPFLRNPWLKETKNIIFFQWSIILKFIVQASAFIVFHCHHKKAAITATSEVFFFFSVCIYFDYGIWKSNKMFLLLLFSCPQFIAHIFKTLYGHIYLYTLSGKLTQRFMFSSFLYIAILVHNPNLWTESQWM